MDATKSYSETCNTIRHYSNLSFSVRILSIVQGLTLVAAWILNYKDCNYLILFAIPFFGLLFTLLIYKFHMGYFDATGYFIKLAASMEETLFPENFRPFYSFKIYHDKKYKSRTSKFIILNAPFTLISILFVFILLLTFLKFLNLIG